MMTRSFGLERLTTFTEWVRATGTARQQAVSAALARIDALEPSIHAWVQIAPEPPTGEGPLAGIPFGVKDIIETEGLATEYGSPIYQGRVGTGDAAIVRELRQRGGLVLGKTQCAAFAYRTPAITRNPCNLAHTPGGSSSGSAAAVAAGMVPFALGTQTAGSILRPASYCGVTGFKASYGVLPMDGVLPCAKSLDTLGFFTHTAADMLALWQSLGHLAGPSEDVPLAAPDRLPDIDPLMAAAFETTLAHLERAGLSITRVPLADTLNALVDAHRTIMFYEAARFHEERFRQYGSRLDDLADLVQEGLAMAVSTYDDARRDVAARRTDLREIYKATPIVLVPAATGPAPHGLASTGDARMNAPWTALGVPAISIPMPVANGMLPLGIQLTSGYGEDGRLLATATRLEQILKF